MNAYKLVKFSHEDVDVIHFGVRWFSDSKPLNDAWLNMKFSGMLKISDTMIPQLQPHFWDKLWRRDFLDKWKVRFPLGLHFEDMGFTWQLLSVARNIYCLPDKLYFYRYRTGSTMERYSQGKGGVKILDFLEISRLCLEFWKKHNIREKYGSSPSYIELEILNRSRDRITRWAGKEFYHKAWSTIRSMIDEFDLGTRLTEFPDLALYYHLPPYAYEQLQKHMLHNVSKQRVVTDTSLQKDMLLLVNERRIYWQYRRIQLLGHLTWGKKRCKYKEKKRRYHELLRRCRQLRKNI